MVSLPAEVFSYERRDEVNCKSRPRNGKKVADWGKKSFEEFQGEGLAVPYFSLELRQSLQIGRSEDPSY